jgi:HK97 family phage prohead protease
MSSLVHKTTQSFDSGLSFILSDDSDDHYGDTILASGWDWKNYLLNPIVLWSHQNHIPIGTMKNLRIVGNSLRGDLHMAPEGTSKRIDELRKLIKCGVLKAVSVGFKPIQKEARSNGGIKYIRQELIEVSLVACPANPNSLLQAKSMGVSTATIRTVFRETNKNLTLAERIAEARATVQAERAEIQRRAEAIVAKIPTGKPKYTEAERAAINRKAKAAIAKGEKEKAEAAKQKSEKKMDAQTRETEAYLENLRSQGLLVEFPAEIQDYTMWRGERIPYSKKWEWRDDE